MNKIHQELKQIATNRGNDIEDLFQDIYTLPLYGSRITSCDSNFSDYLNHIVVNNHNIDGIIVSDTEHHLICSTLPKNEAISPSINAARAISGPFKISLFDQPVYLLQQKIS